MTSGRVGYFDDELHFLAAGRHLAWGYAYQGPLVPLLARAMDSLIPGSLVAERLPVTILTAAGVMLTALIARELGGQRQPIGTGTRQLSTGSGQHADCRAPTAPTAATGTSGHPRTTPTLSCSSAPTRPIYTSSSPK